jgi:hypothetical protein
MISFQKVDSLLVLVNVREAKKVSEKRLPVAGRPGRSHFCVPLKVTSAFPITCPPAGGEAIMSQFRVWPFLPTTIVAFGERNRNPGHCFAGD